MLLAAVITNFEKSFLANLIPLQIALCQPFCQLRMDDNLHLGGGTYSSFGFLWRVILFFSCGCFPSLFSFCPINFRIGKWLCFASFCLSSFPVFCWLWAFEFVWYSSHPYSTGDPTQKVSFADILVPFRPCPLLCCPLKSPWRSLISFGVATWGAHVNAFNANGYIFATLLSGKNPGYVCG